MTIIRKGFKDVEMLRLDVQERIKAVEERLLQRC